MANPLPQTSILTPTSYRKPKILLVDLPHAVKESLKDLGLNVEQGTFGSPYVQNRPQNSSFHAILANEFLPNLHEQEIILIDLTEPKAIPRTDQNTETVLLKEGFGIEGTSLRETIDPRPLAMMRSRKFVDRIVESNGLVVVFTNIRKYIDYKKYELQQQGIPVRKKENLVCDNWMFSGYLALRSLVVADDRGTEATLCPAPSGLEQIVKLLQENRGSISFEVSLSPQPYPTPGSVDGPRFVPLMENKYGAAVAAAVGISKGKGMILLLPQFTQKAELVAALFRDVLPVTHSHLFPEHEGSLWVHKHAYEHPAILSLKKRVEDIQSKADQQKAEIQSEIEVVSGRLSFLHGLITKSGDALVADTLSALNYIGFQDVVDVDRTNAGHANKQEDIRIRDRDIKLLVEVKGLGSLPTEADCLQITKFLNRRKSEWGLTGIQGVFLVNHQRGVQPLDRSNDSVFTPAQIGDAMSDRVALISTWDIFRLIRGMDRWEWPRESVMDVFYQPGRAGLLPLHWQEVGKVAHFYDKLSVVSILVSGTDFIRAGDTIGYAFADRFEEQIVESLEIENQPVNEAGPGIRAGYNTRLPRKDLPVGTSVYKVRDAAR